MIGALNHNQNWDEKTISHITHFKMLVHVCTARFRKQIFNKYKESFSLVSNKIIARPESWSCYAPIYKTMPKKNIFFSPNNDLRFFQSVGRMSYKNKYLGTGQLTIKLNLTSNLCVNNLVFGIFDLFWRMTVCKSMNLWPGIVIFFNHRNASLKRIFKWPYKYVVY